MLGIVCPRASACNVKGAWGEWRENREDFVRLDVSPDVILEKVDTTNPEVNQICHQAAERLRTSEYDVIWGSEYKIDPVKRTISFPGVNLSSARDRALFWAELVFVAKLAEDLGGLNHYPRDGESKDNYTDRIIQKIGTAESNAILAQVEVLQQMITAKLISRKDVPKGIERPFELAQQKDMSNPTNRAGFVVSVGTIKLNETTTAYDRWESDAQEYWKELGHQAAD
jgi:hypothetical protein